MNRKTVDKIMKRLDVNEICGMLDNDSNENIPQLKLYDFLIDVRGTNKFSEIISVLKGKLKTEHALTYINEIEVINQIFSECAKLQNAINIVPPKLILPLMLYWGSLNIDEYISDEAQKFFKERNSDIVGSYEKHAEMTIQAIKSLIYNEKVYDGNKFICKFHSSYIVYSKSKHKKCIMKYIEDSYKVSLWLEKYDCWKNGIYGLNILDKNNLKLVILDEGSIEKNTNPYIKERIFQIQYESRAIDEYHILNDIENPDTDLGFMEFVSQKVIDKHFYCESGDLLVQNVKIKDWLHAYFILYKLSQNDIDKVLPRSLMTGLFLDHKRCKTKKGWIKILSTNGIPIQSAEIIFEHLIFKKGATDLYDYPFIPVKNKYMISRTVSKLIHPARSLISRFNRKDINIDIKGHNFEKNLYNFFNLAQIPFVNLHNKVNGNEYECDAVFYLDNTFVFCECKSRTGHELETVDSEQYVNDVNQLNRISKFYRENMHLVFDAFESKGVKIKDKKFYSIKNIVIHSAPVDGVIVKENVYIMDFDNFIFPFDRGSVFEDYVNVKRLKNVFEGEVTIYKLFKFYDYDFHIYNYKNQIEYVDYEMQLGDFHIYSDDYYIKNYSEDILKKELDIHMKNRLRENGVPESRIKKLFEDFNSKSDKK